MRHCHCKQHTRTNGQRRVEKRAKQLLMPLECFGCIMPQHREHRQRAFFHAPPQVRAHTAHLCPQIPRLIRRLVIGAEGIPVHRYKHEAPAKPEHLERQPQIPLDMPVKPLTIPLRLHSHQRYPPVDWKKRRAASLPRILPLRQIGSGFAFLLMLLIFYGLRRFHVVCFPDGFLLRGLFPFGIFQPHAGTPPSLFPYKMVTIWLQFSSHYTHMDGSTQASWPFFGDLYNQILLFWVF